MFRLAFTLIIFSGAKCELKFSSDQITLEVGEVKTFQAEVTNIAVENVGQITFVSDHEDIADIVSKNVTYFNNNASSWNLRVEGRKPGESGLSANTSLLNWGVKHGQRAFLLIKVHKSKMIERVSNIIGWLYFLAWSISFYPQLYTNYKRKSVIGLNFDFLLLNIYGYIMYNIFNWGVYFIPLAQEQYSLRHPRSINPIRPNDMFFPAHGFLATSATIAQCFIYERAGQGVSGIAKIIVGIYTTAVITSAVLALTDVIWWLDVLYLCSYIKLCATVKKYMPQVYMNYKRKSTQGWSIGGVTLDLTGGFLSIIQMTLDGYNYDDWNVFIENPAKFGLGLLSNGFCLTFIIQHYILYPEKNTEMELELPSTNIYKINVDKY